MMNVVFWASMAILAGFVFEFGRKLDAAKYPDVAIGLFVVLAGGFWLVTGLGKNRVPMPSDPVILILAGFAMMAAHYLISEFRDWRWPRPFVDRRKPANTVMYQDDGDLTRTIRTLEKKEPMASRSRATA